MSSLPYNSFNNYLKQRFGGVVWRVTLEGNFTCPNRDGNRAFGGCTFCTADGSSSRAQSPEDTIAEQLQKGIEKQRKRHRAKKFIAYLQSFTNTYGPLHYLKEVYDQSIAHPDVVMLSIGTRPDSLPNEVIKLIDSYNDKVEVWVDLGLQSVHDDTLQKINRGHNSEEFFDAVKRLKKLSPRTKICAHMIAGLPGEDDDPNLEKSFETAKAILSAPIDGIKVHNLCILKGTKLASDYNAGFVKALEIDDYIDLVIRILAITPPEVTIHRLMAEAPTDDELIAPKWANDKDSFLVNLRAKMTERGVVQGMSLAGKV